MPELFRIAFNNHGRAPWRDRYAEAMDDAINLELASWDASRREWFLSAPVEIQRRGHPDRDAPALPFRRPRHREPWSSRDIETLRRLAAGDETPFVIAQYLGRSEEGIRRKSRALGIN